MNTHTQKPFVITLVHGTWPGKAAWTLPGSTLRKNLEAELRKLGVDGVTFAEPPFRWRGRNLHEDRLAASVLLRGQLETQLATSPASVQVVIAHSHGGNIALKTLGLSPAVRRNALVITLATPFLWFDRRRPDLLVMPMIMSQIVRRFQPHGKTCGRACWRWWRSCAAHLGWVS